ncbi:type IIA topoisomerase (DNA gyrase/topo II, topoisomerase IV), A subunit [Rubidibacter lacunae KORDI 51-2]|uniref:DNA topoisomerase (ATP-hydrolyzing) n=1 Tax=Rubidibacter lacunae KORDI 51-2 TaxID=582515 RepID=U5DEQ5_9CHRO|nr:DNA topoisomerase (ATP-hydrolyzing) [Rubidibacter lacunae]ERN42983.1 type IIA topoisomerase (DNA gyrase/topo II, topoisomerase IV), A subunit [Rubidibacter lacunae KORDI 51-2]
MAEQLDLLGGGQVVPTALREEMERSYLEYAMSVIVGRALPDARDGLKPVHRRILYAMYELGLTPDRPFRKCARVVGDVLGKYHPHGEQAVYDALVRMVQEFSSRYPLLSGHGNFGSLDNDPPAAMRYTETRLAAIAQTAMLDNIGETTVDFIGNFDNSQQEPVVLPAQLPFLLLNGCAGIAVGMATNVPPHNLGELVDGAIALIDRPTLSDAKLFELIPGPDFPTGGEIIEIDGVHEAYRTGRGTIKVRGITSIERLRLRGRRQQRTAIVVTELPYQTNKASWIERVADSVNSGRLEGIADLRDESDRNGMRVVIELKRDADPESILTQLYARTALQSNYGAIFLALVDNRPCQLSLRELLLAFLEFREQTLTRQIAHDLEAAQRRLHLSEGLLLALEQLDATIEILRYAADGTTAKTQMQEQLGITDVQADAILAMPMRRLTGLERQKLAAEATELREQIARYQDLLGNRRELLKAMKKDLRALKRQFNNARRTRLPHRGGAGPSTNVPDEAGGPPALEKTVTKAKRKPAATSVKTTPSLSRPDSGPPEVAQLETGSLEAITSAPLPPERDLDAIVEISQDGCIWWRNDGEQHIAPGRDSTVSSAAGDLVIFRQPLAAGPLVAISDSGKAHLTNLDAVPHVESESQPLVAALHGSATSAIVAFFSLPEESDVRMDLLLLTERGKLKRLPLRELRSLGGRGLKVMDLKDGDRLGFACRARASDELAIATSSGRMLRLPIDGENVPVMSRTAQGITIARLSERHGETFVGCTALLPTDDLLLFTQQGYAKRLPLSELPLMNKNSFGARALTFADRQDRLAAATAAATAQEVAIQTNADRILTLQCSALAAWDRDGTGDRLDALEADEAILSVTPVQLTGIDPEDYSVTDGSHRNLSMGAS